MAPIAIERHDDVAVVTLHHPPANALTRAVLEALEQAVRALATDATRAVVLTGSGKFFSAGLDLFELERVLGSPDADAFARQFDATMIGLFTLDKPVVAAINGHAIAGGAVVAGTADFRLVADGALQLGLSEVQVGAVFPTSALEIVRFACAGPHLPELLYRGLSYRAADAVARRLADEVVPAAELMPRAIALATELGRHRPIAFASSKRALRAEHLARIHAASADGLDPRWQPWREEEALRTMAAFRDRALRGGR